MTPSLTAASLTFLQRHVYERSGIVLGDDKHYLLESRLGPLIRNHGMRSLEDLCAALRAPGGWRLDDEVVELMTTNETYFFREPQHFDALRRDILPELIESRRDMRKLSFWSAASSSGQEAYSIAMLLHELGIGDWNIQILGTDLAPRMLAQAERGRYSQLEVNRGMPAPLLLRYFRRVGLEWELREEIRRMAHFRKFDLRSKMNALGPFDIVLCRNVLIYFDLNTKVKILREMHGTLFRGGRLFLGSTETALPPGEQYTRGSAGSAAIYVAV